MSEKLSDRQIDTLRLLRRSVGADGWAKVSEICWPLLDCVPPDLIERERFEVGGRARFTERGDAVEMYR